MKNTESKTTTAYEVLNQKITGMPKHVQIALLKVIAARANWATIDGIDKETKAEILSENTFNDEDSGERITDHRCDFCMGESDFSHYCELVYARNLEKGMDSGGVGNTFWDAHKAVYDAEDAYIDAVAIDIPQFTPEQVIRLKSSPKWRAEFFKITGIEKAVAE